MIKIERTLTQNEKDALRISGKTEQDMANYGIQALNSHINHEVKMAKANLITDKTISEIEQGLN